MGVVIKIKIIFSEKYNNIFCIILFHIHCFVAIIQHLPSKILWVDFNTPQTVNYLTEDWNGNLSCSHPKDSDKC